MRVGLCKKVYIYLYLFIFINLFMRVGPYKKGVKRKKKGLPKNDNDWKET